MTRFSLKETKISLVDWLGVVDDYWTHNGELCSNCEFNDFRRGCEFLFNDTIPAGNCPGFDVPQPIEG